MFHAKAQRRTRRRKEETSNSSLRIVFKTLRLCVKPERRNQFACELCRVTEVNPVTASALLWTISLLNPCSLRPYCTLRSVVAGRHIGCYWLLCLPSLALPRAKLLERLSMKKNEFSEIASNLLIVGSVSIAFTPFLLGDRLLLVVSGLMKDGGVMISQFSNYLTWLVS